MEKERKERRRLAREVAKARTEAEERARKEFEDRQRKEAEEKAARLKVEKEARAKLLAAQQAGVATPPPKEAAPSVRAPPPLHPRDFVRDAIYAGM